MSIQSTSASASPSLGRRLALTRVLAMLASPAFGLAACNTAQPPLRLALNNWVGYALMHLAHDASPLAEADVRMVEFPSNTASLLALANGDVELAALTLDELLLARDNGLSVQAALVFDESNGADALIVRPDIAAPVQLRGRRVGVESSATGALMLSQTLKVAGLRPDDLTLVPLTADQHVNAFVSHEVDALITFEPMASMLSAQGGVRLLDSSRFPGLIVDVLTVRANLDRVQARQVQTTIARYFQALRQLQEDPADTVRRLSPHQQLPAEAVRSALGGIRLSDASANRAWLAGPAPRLAESARRVSQVMQEAHLLQRAPDLRELCTSRFLPEGS